MVVIKEQQLVNLLVVRVRFEQVNTNIKHKILKTNRVFHVIKDKFFYEKKNDEEDSIQHYIRIDQSSLGDVNLRMNCFFRQC